MYLKKNIEDNDAKLYMQCNPKFTKHVLKSVCCYYRLLWQVRLKCLNISERKPN